LSESKHKTKYHCPFCGEFLAPESRGIEPRGEYFVRDFEVGRCTCGAYFSQIFGDYYEWKQTKTPLKINKKEAEWLDKLKTWTS